MKMVHDDVHVDRSDDPANSIFPRGKLAKLEGKRSPAKGKKGKNGNAARGNYGNVNGRAICPKQRRSAAPEPPRTPLQSGIHKLVQASVRFVDCVACVGRPTRAEDMCCGTIASPCKPHYSIYSAYTPQHYSGVWVISFSLPACLQRCHVISSGLQPSHIHDTIIILFTVFIMNIEYAVSVDMKDLLRSQGRV